MYCCVCRVFPQRYTAAVVVVVEKNPLASRSTRMLVLNSRIYVQFCCTQEIPFVLNCAKHLCCKHWCVIGWWRLCADTGVDKAMVCTVTFLQIVALQMGKTENLHLIFSCVFVSKTLEKTFKGRKKCWHSAWVHNCRSAFCSSQKRTPNEQAH